MLRTIPALLAGAALLAAACGGDTTPVPVSSGTPGKSIRDIALSASPVASASATAEGTGGPAATVTAQPTVATTTKESTATPTAPPPTVMPSTENGPELPDFVINVYQGADSLGGVAVTLYQLLQQGRPVVVNFWGSSCSGCLEEMPAFEKLDAEYGDRVLLVGVDVGEQVGLGTKEGAIELMKQLNVEYATGSTDTENIVEDQKIFGLPRTVFLTPTGFISGEWSGTLDEAQMRDLYEQVLADTAAG